MHAKNLPWYKESERGRVVYIEKKREPKINKFPWESNPLNNYPKFFIFYDNLGF